MKTFLKSALVASLFVAAAAFADGTDDALVSAPAPTESSAANSSDAMMESGLPTVTNAEKAAATADDSAEADGSSESSEGGLVLIDAQSSGAKERRVYGKDAPVFHFEVTAGLQSPSRGMISLEYIVAQEIFNVGLHFTDYNDELFQIGVSALYYPMEIRYFYMFLTSDWISGKYEREERNSKNEYREFDERLNVWRVVVGIGGEVLFLDHFGLYAEAGFEFFAGNGGYYLHMNKKHGHMNNDDIKLPYGAGILIPF